VSQFEFFAQMHQGVQKQTETLPHRVPQRTLASHPAQAAHRKFQVSDRTPCDRCSSVTFTRVGLELFPCTSALLLVVKTSHPATSAPFRGGLPYPAGDVFPVPFGCRPSLVGRAVPLGHRPHLTMGLLPTAGPIGVSTFGIGKRRRVSWPLDAGSWAPPQHAR
jgi:hypothetical protein